MAEAMLAYVAETAPILVLRLNASTHVVTANAHARRLLGDDVIGRPFSELLVDFTSRPDLEALKAVTSGGQLLSVQTEAGGPESFVFRFFPVPEGNLALASPNVVEQDRHRVELLGLNRQLSDLTRQLHLANAELSEKNTALEAAMEQVRQLSGLLPICASCKKIRDDQGYWNQIESYLERYSEARFTHGICPECTWKLYPEFAPKLLGARPEAP